jgi:hypothetical protein
MTDFHELYTMLAQDADRAKLADPATLRRRADRRRRVRVALAAASAALLVGGITAGSQVVLRADRAPLPPGVSVSPEPPASATPPSATPSSATQPSATPSSATPSKTSPVPTSITDDAFLQQADTHHTTAPFEVPSDDLLPVLCEARYGSDAELRTRRTFQAIYWTQPRSEDRTPDGSFDETITVYRSDGARRFMDEVRTAVTACPRQTRNGLTYKHRLLTPAANGDEAVLFEVRYPTRQPDGTLTGGDDVRLVSIVRVGSVVMVLYEQGWEAGWSAERDVVDRFTTRALTRLRSWLD